MNNYLKLALLVCFEHLGSKARVVSYDDKQLASQCGVFRIIRTFGASQGVFHTFVDAVQLRCRRCEHCASLRLSQLV